ncbi:hypothetical protein Dimus_000112 [Dionaea muscipula]
MKNHVFQYHKMYQSSCHLVLDSMLAKTVRIQCIAPLVGVRDIWTICLLHSFFMLLPSFGFWSFFFFHAHFASGPRCHPVACLALCLYSPLIVFSSQLFHSPCTLWVFAFSLRF